MAEKSESGFSDPLLQLLKAALFFLFLGCWSAAEHTDVVFWSDDWSWEQKRGWTMTGSDVKKSIDKKKSNSCCYCETDSGSALTDVDQQMILL